MIRTWSEVAVVRFLLVGVSNTAIGAGLFWFAHRTLPAAPSQVIAYSISTCWSYYWNRRWTFQSQGKLASEAIRFFSLQTGFMVLSATLLGLLVDHARLPAAPSWFAVVALITVLNFIAQRYWAFKKA
jgi:putative flippase GtrA